MKKETYVNLMRWIKARPALVEVICRTNKYLTSFVYTIFIVFMFYMLISRNEDFLRILFTTAISFVIVSIFRKVFDRERPYDKFGEASVIPKTKKGNSFPSRHVFSAFVIAVCICYVYNWLGVLMLVVSILIAIMRVVGGVHYISDVLVGAVIGIASAVFGMWVF